MSDEANYHTSISPTNTAMPTVAHFCPAALNAAPATAVSVAPSFASGMTIV